MTREMASDAEQDEILAAVLRKIGGDGEIGSAVTQEGGAGNAGCANPIGDILSSVLSHPEALSKLPSVIATVKPILEMLGKGLSVGSSPTHSAPSDAASSAYKPASATGAFSKDTSATTKSSDSRTALLCAMKPYLSEERRNAVDYIVKLSRLGEILKTL